MVLWSKYKTLHHKTSRSEYRQNKKIQDINHSNIFLGLSPKAREIKAKINKWDLIKLKTFTEQKKSTK